MGRDRSDVERPNFIRVNEVYISKEHLQIHIGHVTELDNTSAKTPLKVIIQSKAMTKINGKKLRLSNGEEPYVIDLESNDEVDMQFREDKIRIKIHWVPLILNFPHRVQIGSTIQANPIVEQLKKLTEKIDLRITQDPGKATHYIAANDSPTYGLRISLLRGISVVNEKWIDFVLQNQDNYELWFHIDTPDLLPSSTKEQFYLFSNPKRGALLHNCVVLVLEPPTAKLETIVNSLGGTVHFIDVGDLKPEDTSAFITRLELQKDKWGQSTTYLLHPKARDGLSAISDLTDFKTITLDDLFESVCNCSTLNLHQFELRKDVKRKADTQVSQSKRRRVKKISKTEFFNFSSAPSQIEPSSTEQTQAPTLVEKGEQNQLEKDFKSNVIELSPQKVPPEDNTSMMLSDENPAQEASESAQPTSSHTENKPVQPTHEYEKVGKFMPQVSFHEAVKRTKEKQTESIKKDLGLDTIEDEISLQLVDLAVVEYVPLIRSKATGTQAPPTDYSGRKNFKNFKKVALNVRVRLKVELVSATTITEKPQMGIDYNSIPQVANFAGEMPPVKGVEPRGILDQYYMEEDAPLFSFRNQEPEPNNSLFVSEDDSQVQATNNFAITSKKIEDDDDDDDDDQPRFAFRRN